MGLKMKQAVDGIAINGPTTGWLKKKQRKTINTYEGIQVENFFARFFLKTILTYLKTNFTKFELSMIFHS